MTAEKRRLCNRVRSPLGMMMASGGLARPAGDARTRWRAPSFLPTLAWRQVDSNIMSLEIR